MTGRLIPDNMAAAIRAPAGTPVRVTHAGHTMTGVLSDLRVSRDAVDVTPEPGSPSHKGYREYMPGATRVWVTLHPWNTPVEIPWSATIEVIEP